MDPAAPAPSTSRRSAFAQTGAALVVLAWRLSAAPWPSLWKDAVAIAAIYWIFTVFRSGSRAWTLASEALMAYLLAAYVSGQLPRTLEILELF